MKMIVGLGNPGTKYQYTKHNIGFMVVDKIAREHQATFKNPFEAEVAEFFIMEKRSFSQTTNIHE